MKLFDLFKHTATEPQHIEDNTKDEVWVRKGDKFVMVEGKDENAEKGK
jgi:hypothetical protein